MFSVMFMVTNFNLEELEIYWSNFLKLTQKGKKTLNNSKQKRGSFTGYNSSDKFVYYGEIAFSQAVSG